MKQLKEIPFMDGVTEVFFYWDTAEIYFFGQFLFQSHLLMADWNVVPGSTGKSPERQKYTQASWELWLICDTHMSPGNNIYSHLQQTSVHDIIASVANLQNYREEPQLCWLFTFFLFLLEITNNSMCCFLRKLSWCKSEIKLGNLILKSISCWCCQTQ